MGHAEGRWPACQREGGAVPAVRTWATPKAGGPRAKGKAAPFPQFVHRPPVGGYQMKWPWLILATLAILNLRAIWTLYFHWLTPGVAIPDGDKQFGLFAFMGSACVAGPMGLAVAYFGTPE